MIKYKGSIIYDKPFAKVSFSKSWCNSMYQFNWTIYVYRFENDKLEVDSLPLSFEYYGESSPIRYFEIETNNQQEFYYNYYKQQQGIKSEQDAQQRELNTVRLHKTVEVYKGRKVPKGTIGEVFWLGNTQWGVSVGLRLICGKKLFTSLNNVKVKV